ncbi:MAG: AraC family transcriptional regulator [Lachnospiraceae bacterium]|nr:AraC family transcriptional regulator [Lachnospiraceae bacterium]
MANKKRSSVIEYRNYYLHPEFPVLLLSGEHWRISDVPSGRLHFHNCTEIGICHSDSGTMEIMGVKHRFQAGDIVMIPQNIPHTTYSDKGCASHWSYIFLDPSTVFQGILPDTRDREISFGARLEKSPVICGADHPELMPIAESAIKELETRQPGFQIAARSLLVSLLIKIWRIQTDMSKEAQSDAQESPSAANLLIIEPALNYIEKNYPENFAIDTLADQCHFSLTHFRRVFLQIMGRGPLEYLNNTRIFKACYLLRSTEDSILSISEAVGFRSIATFNRRFMELMQTTPRSYRAGMQRSEKHNEKQIIMEFSGWLMPER